MIFTAYLDEADIHGPAPTIIMAAYLGHAYQWRRFETKLAKIQRGYGFQIFHGKDFKAKRREFDGWSDDKCSALIGELTKLVSETLTQGAAVHLEHERYVREYKSEPIPKKMRLDSQYGVCFRVCLASIIRVLAARDYRDSLHVVIERGHRNVWDCERIFNDLSKIFASKGFEFMKTFTVQDKTSCAPLMVADLVAAAYSTLRAKEVTGKVDREAYQLPGPQKGALAFLQLAPGALRRLKDEYEISRRKRIEYWLSNRADHTQSATEKPPPLNLGARKF